jgi:hypothetical protein
MGDDQTAAEPDELDAYLLDRMRDPAFRSAMERVQSERLANADLLAVVPVSERPDQRLLDAIEQAIVLLRDGKVASSANRLAAELLADAVEAVLSDTQTDPERCPTCGE